MTNTVNNIIYKKGDGSKLGAVISQDGAMFTKIVTNEKSLFLNIYNHKDSLIDRIDMFKYKVNSQIVSVCVSGIDISNISYLYEVDGKLESDPYLKNASTIVKYKQEKSDIKGKVYIDDFDWGNDKPLSYKYNDVIAYQLHVRGYTAHKSSKVQNKGTFLGIIEKIPYFKELGINQLVLMPAYDFDEINVKDNKSINYLDYTSKEEDDKKEPTINFWGFKEGNYYVPKLSYSNGNPVNEFKTLVRELHKASIEVVMRFYFPDSFNRSLIQDILRFWIFEYHIDGFFLMGNNIPMDIISDDFSLRDVKIYNNFFDKSIVCDKGYGFNRNLAYANLDFAVCCRKYLKSDEDMLHNFLYRQRLNPTDIHVINYITDYEGFTLNDLVSYDHKHNDDNGEDNKDGENYNYSWNCGAEGISKKQSIIKLRISQIKNALVFLLLAQGTPMLLAGDEFLNSQNGNNNPYCQDNEIGWINWKDTKASKEIFEFTKELIALRKSHPILHPYNEFRIMDYAACGYPDLSYHSENAWAPKFDNYLRNIGIMICGKYAMIDRTHSDDFFYIAYNMHWEEHTYGLPKLPKGYKWTVLLSTYDDIKESINVPDNTGESIKVPGRYITILTSKKVDVIEVKETKN